MAKVKKNDRGTVQLDLIDLSNETRNILSRLSDVVALCGDMMSIKDLSEIVNTVKAECGEDAEVSILIDDYFGNSVNIRWSRPETDEEWAKRLEANKKRAVAARKQRATLKKKKEEKERAELARLQAKYPIKAPAAATSSRQRGWTRPLPRNVEE